MIKGVLAEVGWQPNHRAGCLFNR